MTEARFCDSPCMYLIRKSSAVCHDAAHHGVKLDILCVLVTGCTENPFISEKIYVQVVYDYGISLATL